MITEAIILAGGLGTRLRNAVPDLPKCMAPVNDIPFICFVIEYLKKQGINHFVFSLGYRSKDVIDFLDKNYPMLDKTYVIEDEPLGTGGAVKKALQTSETNDVVIVNGDTIFKIDLEKLFYLYEIEKADCTIALKKVDYNERYGTVKVDENNKVNSFAEKKDTAAGLINGGIYIVNKKSFLKTITLEKFSFEKDYLEKYLTTHNITAYTFNNYFIDIGIPEDYNKFSEKTKQIQKRDNQNIESKSITVIELIGHIFDSIL